MLLRPCSSAAEVIWKEPSTDVAALELDVRPIAVFILSIRSK